MNRRDFVVLGTAAALSSPDRLLAQGTPPLVAVLGSGAPAPLFTAAIAEGLGELGYVEGRNVRLDYRWARGVYEQIQSMANELVQQRPAVVLSFGTPAAKVAKAATAQASPAIPLVFSFGSDPVAEGLVASLGRPGGHVTGSTSIAGELAPKRIELLREILGGGVRLGILVNPDNPLSHAERLDAERAARASGQALDVLTARNPEEIDAAFASLKERNIGALIIAVDTYYFSQMRRMAGLAARYRAPAIGPLRDFALGGGLMTYGASIYDVNRKAAAYVGRVLAGQKPADLPVLQPTKFELLVNLKAAKDLGLELPTMLIARADEVIE